MTSGTPEMKIRMSFDTRPSADAVSPASHACRYCSTAWTTAVLSADAVAPPRLPHAMRGATRSTIRGLVIGSSMRPIQLMRNSLVIDVALVHQTGFHEHALRAEVVGASDRDDRGTAQRFAAEAQELFRDFGGQSPAPVLRVKAVAELDFIHAFDVEMPEHAAPRDLALGIAQHPEAVPIVVPMLEVPGHVRTGVELAAGAAEQRHVLGV